MTLSLPQALQKAIEAQKAGHVDEARQLYLAILQVQPTHPAANFNMGKLAVELNKLQEALPFFTKAYEAKPANPQFVHAYVVALVKLRHVNEAKSVLIQAKTNGAKSDALDQLEKQLNELKNPQSGEYTIESFRAAIKENPKAANNYYNLARALHNGGDLIAAIENYKQAIKIRPDYVIAVTNLLRAQEKKREFDESMARSNYIEALLNLANVQHESGDQEAAIEGYKQAIKIEPNHANAYFNMGCALVEMGDLEAAIESYKQAIKIEPSHANAYFNMGITLTAKGDLMAAVESYMRAIKIKPDFSGAYNNIGIILGRVTFTKSMPEISAFIIKLLETGGFVKPSDISNTIICLLTFDPAVKKALNKYRADDVKPNIQKILSDLSQVSLLVSLMKVCPIPNSDIEGLLTKIRSSIILTIPNIINTVEICKFVSALALQCFANEYVYSQSVAETKAVLKLDKLVKKQFSLGLQPNPLVISILACYKTLYAYSWCGSLLVTSELEEVARRQIVEIKQEKEVSRSILMFDNISNNISLKVKSQYESNPYPRWINIGLNSVPLPIELFTKTVNLKIFDESIKKCTAPQILIAGCGTGQQSIHVATCFKGCNVLAVDLSLSSLSYAKRKADELGVNNIEYMQADILSLVNLSQQFDIIQCAGVLHHMENPMVGWKVLAERLRPGGLMMIGLYSETARKHITKVRNEIIQSAIASDESSIKSFRSRIMQSKDEQYMKVRSNSDFYSLSNVRDLLFHVQEHRFTIPEIKFCLVELGLKFCGFQTNEIIRKFKRLNPHAEAIYDLDEWNDFEHDNPDAFIGMYQFWCQKLN
jgi:tetratricopeptide (TPR) repeat protein/2-polyprenyl-3-methyl-5-hydroxy-6-metoxy-1,4-benzoquinol methylase